jgi:hypothetical protein
MAKRGDTNRPTRRGRPMAILMAKRGDTNRPAMRGKLHLQTKEYDLSITRQSKYLQIINI